MVEAIGDPMIRKLPLRPRRMFYKGIRREKKFELIEINAIKKSPTDCLWREFKPNLRLVPSQELINRAIPGIPLLSTSTSTSVRGGFRAILNADFKRPLFRETASQHPHQQPTHRDRGFGNEMRRWNLQFTYCLADNPQWKVCQMFAWISTIVQSDASVPQILIYEISGNALLVGQDFIETAHCHRLLFSLRAASHALRWHINLHATGCQLSSSGRRTTSRISHSHVEAARRIIRWRSLESQEMIDEGQFR